MRYYGLRKGQRLMLPMCMLIACRSGRSLLKREGLAKAAASALRAVGELADAPFAAA